LRIKSKSKRKEKKRETRITYECGRESSWCLRRIVAKRITGTTTTVG